MNHLLFICRKYQILSGNNPLSRSTWLRFSEVLQVLGESRCQIWCLSLCNLRAQWSHRDRHSQSPRKTQKKRHNSRRMKIQNLKLSKSELAKSCLSHLQIFLLAAVARIMEEKEGSRYGIGSKPVETLRQGTSIWPFQSPFYREQLHCTPTLMIFCFVGW